MIDYLLAFASDAAREATFPYPQDEDGNTIVAPSWMDSDRTILPGRVWYTRAVYDEAGAVTTPEAASPYAWLAVRCPARDDAIEAMAACVICTDPALASTGKFVVFHRFPSGTDLGSFEPVFAGDQYPLLAGISDDLADNMIE